MHAAYIIPGHVGRRDHHERGNVAGLDSWKLAGEGGGSRGGAEHVDICLPLLDWRYQ